MRRLFVSLLLVVVCVLPLAGRASARTAHNVTTLTFMSYVWPGQAGFQKVLARFEQLHPGTKIKQEWLSWNNYWPKVETQAVAGQPPDVFINSLGYMEQFALKGFLLPLDAYFKRDKISLDQFHAPAVATGRWAPTSLASGHGPLMSFPWDYQAGIWVYNKTMFQRAGVTLPKESWTWADVLADAKKLTKTDASGKVTQYGILAPSDPTGDLLLLTWAMNGRFWTPDLKKIDLLNPGFRKAMQFSHDLIWKYKVAPPPNPQSQVDPFMTGKVAMYATGTWMLFPYQNIKNFEWDVAPIPRSSPSRPSIDWGSPDLFSIGKMTKNRNAAWELLKFLVAPGQGQQMIAKLKIEPPVVKAYDKLYYNFSPPAHIALIVKSFKGARSEPDFLGCSQVSDPFTKGIQQILLSPGPIEPTLKSTQQAMQTILDQWWGKLREH